MFAKFVSNLLFCGVFALAAVNHIVHFEEEIPKVVNAGIPEEYAPICLGFALSMMVLGTVLVITVKFEKIGYICYVLFLVPVTGFMHLLPWIEAMKNPLEDGSEQTAKMHSIQTLKNISLIGACLKLWLSAGGTTTNRQQNSQKHKSTSKKSKKKKRN